MSNLENLSLFKLKGVNSDEETCSACGKTGLKRVMWLDELDAEGNETGSVSAFGTTCGARVLGFMGHFTSVEKVETAVNRRDSFSVAIAKAEKMSLEFQDDIGVYWSGSVHLTVRGKAFDSSPYLYRTTSIVKWVKFEGD